VVAVSEGSSRQKRVRGRHAFGQHDEWGVLGEVRFPRAASGMLTWPPVNGMG